MNTLESPEYRLSFIKQQLAKDLAKFSKSKNGKGPDSIEIDLNEDYVLCVFKGFMTKAEEIIVQSGSAESVCHNRVIYVTESIDELNGIFLKYLNRKIKILFPCYIPKKKIACWTIFLD